MSEACDKGASPAIDCAIRSSRAIKHRKDVGEGSKKREHRLGFNLDCKTV
jgi:hypothetical protein